MSAVAIVARLDRVRECGLGKWTARCPSHEDGSPSLSIRELPDGTVLLHDFGGCSAADVLAAVGLELHELFPERTEHHKAPARDRKHWHATREALRAVKGECLNVAIAAENLAAGVSLGTEDRDRLLVAAQRIRSAAEVAL
jgi:hypothetical protein